MKKLATIFIIQFLFLSNTSLMAIDAQKILYQADKVLIPENARYKMFIEIKENNEVSKYEFIGYKKGNFRNIFFTIKPVSIYGQSHLRIKDDIWMYFPLADTSIRQRYKSSFIGSGLSYADILYNDLLVNYKIESVKSDYKYNDFRNKQWNGRDINSLDAIQIKLIIRKGSRGYAKVITYIEKKSLLTIKREYYTLSGDMIKKIYYNNYNFVKSKVDEFEIRIINLLNTNQKTKAKFYNIESQDNIPNHYFTTNFLRTFQPNY